MIDGWICSWLTEESEHTAVETASRNAVLVACSLLLLSAVVCPYFIPSSITGAAFVHFFSGKKALRINFFRTRKEKQKRASRCLCHAVADPVHHHLRYVLSGADSHASDLLVRFPGSESEKMRAWKRKVPYTSCKTVQVTYFQCNDKRNGGNHSYPREKSRRKRKMNKNDYLRRKKTKE
ncbi:hypothetical protein HPP92_016886 [Vanilla planifolia]|uniref:Transmembrane protein n=1 Tax=Vanilla planifolia TaxID=51239 RepID=A0A835QFM1_VANPL|nr:hypothetical protein HPP92_016886 [Vanilla planifolia]